MFLALALTFVPSLAAVEVTAAQIEALIIVLGAAVVVGAIGSIKALLDIIGWFKPNPSHDTKFASKAELEAVRLEVAASEGRSKAAVAEHEKRQEAQRAEHQQALNEIFRELRSIHRAIGRTEGHHEG
jgi:hypothetical protein